MPASYPGTVKVFSTKIDLVDTVFAAHINDLQLEVDAIETILGVNPQGSDPGGTVASRLAALEANYMLAASPGRPEPIFGAKTFENEIFAAGGVHAVDHNNLATSTLNILETAAGIQALNPTTNAPVDLPLQGSGGRVLIGGNLTWHSGNDGPGSGLDADTLDGVQGSGYSPISHAHGFSGSWSGIPSSGYVNVSFGTNIGWTPSFISCSNQDPLGGVTYAPLLLGIDSYSPTGFRVRWINQVDGNPFNSPIVFTYWVQR